MEKAVLQDFVSISQTVNKLLGLMSDKYSMALEKTKNSKKARKKPECCAYRDSCYIASELNCFGYKTDCILYRQSNGEQMAGILFDKAMDELIDKTRHKYASKTSK